MTRESASGSRTPEGPDAFAPTSQLATFADDEAQWNNLIRVANASDRNALTAPELRDGVLVEQLDDHSIWQRVGSSWVLMHEQDTGWVNLTLLAGASVADSLTPQIRRRGGIVYLRGRATAAAPSGDLFTAPVGYRIGQTARMPVLTGSSGATPAVLVVESGGRVGTSSGTVVNLTASWPADG